MAQVMNVLNIAFQVIYQQLKKNYLVIIMKSQYQMNVKIPYKYASMYLQAFQLQILSLLDLSILR